MYFKYGALLVVLLSAQYGLGQQIIRTGISGMVNECPGGRIEHRNTGRFCCYDKETTECYKVITPHLHPVLLRDDDDIDEDVVVGGGNVGLVGRPAPIDTAVAWAVPWDNRPTCVTATAVQITTWNTWSQQADRHVRQRQYVQALGLYQNVYEARVRYLGADHVDTLQTQYSIGWTLVSLRRYNHGVVVLQDNLVRRQKVLGYYDVRTLQTWYYYAYCLEQVGRLREARDNYQEVYTRRVQVIGATHADTVTAERSLDRVSSRLTETVSETVVV